ncbi:transcription repressor OFP17 [Tripterygium wilfordii]|nr:transcription repressor OFP17 [Tripterygium wilfordii]
MDRLVELRSLSNKGLERVHFPSPLTPAYLRASRARKTEPSGNDEVEDACRSFENYLVDMIVEEGKTRDLMDVEELLYCWKNLSCPVFKDLVCRFYGELCKDLFSPADNNDIDSPK